MLHSGALNYTRKAVNAQTLRLHNLRVLRLDVLAVPFVFVLFVGAERQVR